MKPWAALKAIPHRASAAIFALAPLTLILGCAASDPVGHNGNPLLGTWRAEVPTPIGQFNLGRWQFSSDHMYMPSIGANIEVEYEISGGEVRVIPRDFGPELELTMVDANTAKLSTRNPFITLFGGDVLSLRRVD
jgi:hypothetical protein